MTSAVGINHVALEVGDLDAAVEFYRSIFGFPEPNRVPRMAFLRMGDQFIALSEGRSAGPTAPGTSAWWSTTRRRCEPR